MDHNRPEPPHPAVKRLSLYFRQLQSVQTKGQRTISSKELGKSLGLGDAQIRKDLACFGQFGHPGVGYRVDELVARLRHILGTDKTWKVLLVGAGNLGRALLAYRGFEARGFQLVAVFDVDPGKVGGQFGTLRVQPLSELENTARTKQIQLAMLTVPAASAQEVADRLVACGIRGLLNFAPISLSVPPDVALNTVDLAVRLEQLSFQASLASDSMPTDRLS